MNGERHPVESDGPGGSTSSLGTGGRFPEHGSGKTLVRAHLKVGVDRNWILSCSLKPNATLGSQRIESDGLLISATMKTQLLCAASLLLAVHCHSQVFTYAATLTGADESPANASPATGTATVAYDSAAHTIQVDVSFFGLVGSTTASHIHAPTLVPGTGTAAVLVPFSGFPTGVTAGSYSQLIPISGGTESTLASAMAAGTAYVNIHSPVFPGGEIRGFLASIPEPASTALATAGALGGLALWRRKSRAGAR